LPESIVSALDSGTAILRGRSDSPRADAVLLLSRALGRDSSYVVAHSDDVFNSEAARAYYADCDRRAAGTPIAYVLGTAGFYGRIFSVDERVLVPRSETESLIDAAITHAARRHASAMRILDIGTGSGALACTLACELPDATVDATDVSAGALALAATNAANLAVADRCGLHLGNLAEPVAGRQYDLVVANLPYVETSAIPPEPAPLAFEPKIALDGGDDGLRVYAELLPALPALLLPGGLALFEAAPHQMERLRAMAGDAFANGGVAIGRDLGGSERFVAVTAPEL
jgi:release factor glutamine methyltransferase